MRGGFGLFFGSAKRNDPVKLVDPRPLPIFTDDAKESDAAHDGYSVLSRANPQAQGSPPPVSGVIGPAYQGPDQSFEQ